MEDACFEPTDMGFFGSDPVMLVANGGAHPVGNLGLLVHLLRCIITPPKLP